MYRNTEAKVIADQVRRNAQILSGLLSSCFEKAAACSDREVAFFRELLRQIPAQLNGSFNGVRLTCRSHEVHQKPRVRVPSRNFQCELADLLVVVKYRLTTGDIERKSILFQVKLSKANSSECAIDQNQLTLLAEWPSFDFG